MQSNKLLGLFYLTKRLISEIYITLQSICQHCSVNGHINIYTKNLLCIIISQNPAKATGYYRGLAPHSKFKN